MTIPFFSMGGLFYWQDKYVYAGWKIQENIWSRRCRILDSHNVCRFKGSLRQCRSKLTDYIKDWEITLPSREAVVIIPGLFQGKRTFERLIETFQNVSYEVIFVSLPMFRFDVAQKATALNKLLNRRTDIKKFHFIAAGTGGLVLRKTLSLPSLWKNKIGRSVLICVPNNGIGWMEKYSSKWLYKKFLGKMGKCLLPAYAKKIPLMTGEFATVNGGNGEGTQGFIPFIKGDNDGLLSAEDAFHENAKADFLIPDGIHFLLPNEKKTVDICKQFIRCGHSTRKRLAKERNFAIIFTDD